MLRTLLPICVLALSLPTTVRAETVPEEGPVFCEYRGSIGFFTALIGLGDASTSASSEEEYGCPKSSRPVLPSNPPSTPPRERPLPGEALR